MGRRTHEMADVIKGTPTVQPGDDLFWFGQPQLVLLLINFVLFQVDELMLNSVNQISFSEYVLVEVMS